MNEFIGLVRQFLLGFRLWVTVTPWEQAIRVRLGRHLKLLRPGVHLKIPLLDLVYLQSVRMRVTQLPRQTIISKDNHTITLTAAIGYEICDIGMLYKTLHHPEDTISNLAQAAIVRYVSTHPLSECMPLAIEAELKAMDLACYGLHSAEIFINDFAVARTYRVIGDYGNYAWGAKLSTDALHERAPRQ
jgi:hypothetical protein